MAVLYSKYRPKNFSEVTGQDVVVTTLKNAVLEDKLAHAYLFCGSRGVGKTTLARILAKSANCLDSRDGEPCLECVICKAINDGNFLDLQEIDAASNTGVDNIRELIENIAFRPTQGKLKVYIIDEVHMLSKGAFNALLKTLEEPPEHAIFILATTEIHKVPATIISRTQRFDFSKLNNQDIVKQLSFVVSQEKREVDSEILELIALQSAGGMRDALTRLEKVLAVGDMPGMDMARKVLGVTDEAVIYELLEILNSSASEKIPKFLEKLNENSLDYQILVKDILEILRRIMLLKLSNLSLDAKMAKLSGMGMSELVFLSRIFLKTYKDIASSVDPEIPFLLGCLESVGLGKKETVDLRPSPVVQNVSEPVKQSVNLTEQLNKVLQAKPKIKEESVKSEDFVGVIDEEKLKNVWPMVVEKVKELNGPLGTLLKNSPLLGTENHFAIVGVKYLFHKEHLESQKNSQLICDIIQSIAGFSARINAKILKSETVPEDSVVLGDALQVFGGEIIE